MRDLLKNITKWNSTNNVREIINLLPIFCDNFDYQIGQSLLPNLGEYYLNSYIYDINDFMRNPKNLCFKVILSEDINDKSETSLIPRFLIITSMNILIIESVDEKYKNICKINYVGDIFEIEKVNQITTKNELYKDLTCLQIIWNKNYNYQLNYAICGDTKNLVAQKIEESLTKKIKSLNEIFKYFEKSSNLDKLDKIIEIKEKLVENRVNDAIFQEINNLYQKKIEVLSSKSDDEFMKYLERLKKFINKYDKLKAETNKKTEKKEDIKKIEK